MAATTLPIPSPDDTLGLGGPFIDLEDATYGSIITTIINEISPETSLATPLPSGNALDIYLTPYLRASGYLGDGSDRKSIVAFLQMTLQAHRLVIRRNLQKQSAASAEDVQLASALSKIVTALQISPESDEDDRSILLKSLQTVNSLLKDVNVSSLGELLLAKEKVSEMTVEQRTGCEKLIESLQNDHRTRMGLLMTRLEVTTQTFSRAAEKDAKRFESIKRDVEQSCGKGVTIFEALAAREWILQEQAVSARSEMGNNVKEFVMGQVPDRGGRLKQHAGAMPKFRERLMSGTEMKMDKGSGKKGRGKQKRKR